MEGVKKVEILASYVIIRILGVEPEDGTKVVRLKMFRLVTFWQYRFSEEVHHWRRNIFQKCQTWCQQTVLLSKQFQYQIQRFYAKLGWPKESHPSKLTHKVNNTLQLSQISMRRATIKVTDDSFEVTTSHEPKQATILWPNWWQHRISFYIPDGGPCGSPS